LKTLAKFRGYAVSLSKITLIGKYQFASTKLLSFCTYVYTLSTQTWKTSTSTRSLPMLFWYVSMKFYSNHSTILQF